MDKMQTVQEALTELIVENRSMLNNSRDLVTALMSHVTPGLQLAFFRKALLDANIGEILLAADDKGVEERTKAAARAVKALKAIHMQEKWIMQIVQTLTTAMGWPSLPVREPMDDPIPDPPPEVVEPDPPAEIEIAERPEFEPPVHPPVPEIDPPTEIVDDTGADEKIPVKIVVKGERIPAPMAKQIRIAFRAGCIPVGMEIDAYAFALWENGKVSGDGDLVFFGNPQHETNGIYLDAAANIAGIGLTLEQIPAKIRRIAVCFAIYCEESRSLNDFSQVQTPEVMLYADDKLCYEFPLQLNSEKIFTSMEFYRRHDEWKINFIGAGYAEGLRKLCKSYGLEVI